MLILGIEESLCGVTSSFCFPFRKDYENHMLQSRLHFRIHSALQEIKHLRKEAKETSKRAKQLRKHSKRNMNNNTSSVDEDSISVSLEDSPALERQDSSSSFETAPENSDDEDERNLGQTKTEFTPNALTLRETTL